MSPIEKDKLMWSPKKLSDTQMGKFVEFLKTSGSVDESCQLNTYDELYKWSLEHIDKFWEAVWKFCGVRASRGYDKVVNTDLGITDVPTWFDGSMLNYAEHALHWDDDHVALHAVREGRSSIETVTYRELKKLVERYASALKSAGVVSEDRVVGYIPNCIEAVAAMLAASSMGAVWSSTSPDFGALGVLERFRQMTPKILFSVNGVQYNGKLYTHLNKLQDVVNGLPSVEKVVVINYIKDEFMDISRIRNSMWLEDFLPGSADSVTPLTFEQLPFSHPLYIMCTSGTTGLPKCMVHCQGGILIKHFEEHILQGNSSRSDMMLYYTTTGWMMWNWLVGLLTIGGTCVLYDGSPLIPSATVLWDLVDELKITILGTGAKWLSVLEEKNVKPLATHKLTSLHTILSTGSPLKPASYEYVYRDIKSDVLLGSITGGTDIVGCFAAQNWTVPVFKGEIQSRTLGCAMECWDESGKAVYNEDGEMVVTKPFPSMPVFFWKDEDGSKYKKAYFDKFPGVWSHGDHCRINDRTGGVWMLGRSDGVLNPNGVRFGSAEIYSIVESISEIQDSVCVAQRNKDNTEERVVLFVRLTNKHILDEALLKKIRTEIRQLLSARHVPAVILQVMDIPYTISGKKVELAVGDMIAGRNVARRAAFSNPDSLDLYTNIAELQGY